MNSKNSSFDTFLKTIFMLAA